MLFICMAVAYSIRTGISVAIIAMVDTTNNVTSVQVTFSTNFDHYFNNYNYNKSII